MKNNRPAWGFALGVCLPLFAAAQATQTEAPKAAPPLAYTSAFADYKPYKDVTPANWREVNATVAGAPGGASGHAGHSMGGMKGMEMPATPAASASAPMTMKPMTAPMTAPMKPLPKKPMPMHEGHHKMGAKP